ncbi:MAG: hypothetical protein JW889_00940 [Verrucomicrobia bacterium]|nr:hypothetical protein [Verrucomicrobiota bacterium]
MWQCECGEFNNEESNYCVQCNKLRVAKTKTPVRAAPPTNTESVFRRIQDFILFDIAATALLVVYCFWRASQSVEVRGSEGEVYKMPALAFESVVPLLLVVIMQLWLLVYLLRALYRVALTSERNSVFLQKIYQKYEGIEEEAEGGESAVQPLIKPPTSGGEKERRRK